MNLGRLFAAAGGILRSPVAVVVVVGFLTIVAVGSGLTGTLSVAGLTPPAEESYTVSTWKVTGKVQFQSGHGTDDRFISSWYGEGRGEPFTIQGSISVPFQAYLYSYEYKLFSKTSRNSDWTLVGTSMKYEVNREMGNFNIQRPGQHTLDAWTTSVTGAVVGILRAELWITLKDNCNVFGASCESVAYRAAQDGATILSGAGSVSFTKPSNRYEEGEKVTINVRTDEGNWRMMLFDGTGKTRCDLQKFNGLGLTLSYWSKIKSWETVSTTKADPTKSGETQTLTADCGLSWSGQRVGSAGFTIPKGAFVRGGNNEWTVVLQNDVVDQQILKTFVVDYHEAAPEVPKTQTKDADGKVITATTVVPVGQRLVYEMESRVNPSSGAKVSYFVVYIWHGDTPVMPPASSDNWISNGITLIALDAGGGLYKASWHFDLKKAANVQKWSVAYDSDHRPSGTSITSEQAQEQEKGMLDATTPNTGPETRGIVAPNTDSQSSMKVAGGTDQPTGPVDAKNTRTADALTGLILAILGVLASIALWAYLPAPGMWKVAGIALLNLGLLYYGGWFGGMA